MNPYFSHAGAFALALILYMFGWSDLYPPITPVVFIFLASLIGIFTFFGLTLNKSKKIEFKAIAGNVRYPLLITSFIFILWSVEFVHAGGVPLIKILLKQPYNYRIFGVPTLHVFVVTFASFYTIYLFHIYLSQKNKVLLLLYLVNLSAAILIYNRAMLFFNLAASVFLYFVYRPRILIRHVAVGTLALVLLLYLFGVLGSLRVSREARVSYTNNIFLDIGVASAGFRQSLIPGEFFWTYIYVSSPLANLQTNINGYEVKPFSMARFREWFVNEVLPDFISKRINSYTGHAPEPDKRIPGPFNASSIYSCSYSYLGWFGLVGMMATVLLLPILYLKLLPDSSPFFLTGLAILNTMFLFMVFENTLRFTGLSFQLVYPFVMTGIVNRLPVTKKFLT